MNWNAILTMLCFFIISTVLPFVLLRYFRQKKFLEGLTNYRDEGLGSLYGCFFRKGIMCTCRHINKIGRLNCERCGVNLLNARAAMYSLIFFSGTLLIILGLIDNETWIVVLGGVLVFLSVAGTVVLSGYKHWAIRMNESAIVDNAQFLSEHEVEAIEYARGDILGSVRQNTKRMTRSEIIQEIKVFIGETPGDFYVGVTKNPKQTKNQHNIEGNWKSYKMWNNESARTVEATFMKHGCKVGTSVVDTDAVFVYVYKARSEAEEQSTST